MPLSVYILAPLTFIAVSADLARAYSASFNTLIRWTFGSMMRPEELPEGDAEISINGATCVLIGALFLALIVPLRIAVPVLIMAMVADAAAALVGRQWGDHSFGSRSATLEGTAAFMGTGLATMALFPGVSFGPAVAGVVTGAIIEALPLPINDNIRVPVAAAFAVWGTEALFLGSPSPPLAGLIL